VSRSSRKIVVVLMILLGNVATGKTALTGYIKVDWPPIDDAKSYEVLLERKGKSGKFSKYKSSIPTMEPPWEGAVPLGTYQVSYRAILENGEKGPWSEPTIRNTTFPKVEVIGAFPIWKKSTEHKVLTNFKWKRNLNMRKYKFQIRRTGSRKIKSYLTKKRTRKIKLKRMQSYEWRVTPNIKSNLIDDVPWQALFIDEMILTEDDLPETETYLSIGAGGGLEQLSSYGFIGSTDGAGITTTSTLKIDYLPKPERAMVHIIAGLSRERYETTNSKEITTTDAEGNSTVSITEEELKNERYDGYVIVRSRTNLSRTFYGLGGIAVIRQLPIIVADNESKGEGKLGVQNVNALGINSHFQTDMFGGTLYLDYNAIPLGSGTRYFIFNQLSSQMRWTWHKLSLELGFDLQSVKAKTTRSCSTNEETKCSYSETSQSFSGTKLGFSIKI